MTWLSIALAFTLIFGGTGATVYAAQDSLPNQPLYAVKTLTEDAQLALTHNATAQVQLLEQFTARRVEEVQALAEAGDAIPEKVQTRLSEQLQQMMQATAEMDDATMQQTLAQVQTMLQTQMQTLSTVQAQSPMTATQVLSQVQTMLREHEQLAAMGTQDLAQFRETVEAHHTGPNHPTVTPAGSGASPLMTPRYTEEPPHATPTVHPTEMPRVTPGGQMTATQHITATEVPHAVPTNRPTEMPQPTTHPTEPPHPTVHPTEPPHPAPTMMPTQPPQSTPVPTEPPHQTPAPTEPPHQTPAPTEPPHQTPAPTEPPHQTPMPTEPPHQTPMPTEPPMHP